MVEIVFQTPTSCGFAVDIHYVMRAQDPGFYFFLAGRELSAHCPGHHFVMYKRMRVRHEARAF